MRAVLAVALGGAAGALLRYWLSTAVYRVAGTGFPWGTLAVNVLGSAVMGVLFVLVQRGVVPEELRLALAVGVLGAFTTFSTFSIETLVLLEEGAWGRAMASIVASLGLCLLACGSGMLLARRWL